MTYNLKPIIDRYIANNQTPNNPITLLQVGGNDGIQDDLCRESIIQHRINSHILEPIPYLFEELQSNYKTFPWVMCHNLAITNKDGSGTMCHVYPNKDLPTWCKGLGTFDTEKNFLGSGRGGYKLLENLSNSLIYKQVQDKMIKTTVQTCTLSSFLQKNNINNIDIYMSDTEGYDYIIFNQIDFSMIQPAIICMETHTLEQREIDIILSTLKLYEYTILNNTWDTVAMKF
jgi:FkbM family methyltransferase